LRIAIAGAGIGGLAVMKLAQERAPDGFRDIESVLPLAERAEIAASYKRTAGFDPTVLNERPSWSVT
jgi:hypothetical protein